MRAWLIESYEGVGKLRLAEVADPEPGPGQALLRLRFAALNPADDLLAKGMYPAEPPLPHVLGRDGVGEVLAIGAGVENISVGETVGILRCSVGVEVWGTFAEMVLVPAVSLIRIPTGWSLEDLSGAPLVFLTAWQALTQWSDPPGPPSTGSVVLVTGASGGVGLASVLVAKSFGLTVVALSRSPEKGARVKELGADFVFNPADENLHEAVLAAIAPKVVDLAVDNVSGPLFSRVVAMLGSGGRISVVGRSGGVVPEFNTATLFSRRIRIGGVAVGAYTSEQAQGAWRQIIARLDLVQKRPVVDSIFAFEDLRGAFVRLAQAPLGKVLVRIAG